MRKIDDILLFRGDISPFLVHLTRNFDGVSAADRLKAILHSMCLNSGPMPVSDARFGMNTLNLAPEEKKRYFNAVCFTETPLDEVHCLLDIAYRQINLEPYGLVFLKEGLQRRGVSPVFYLNNEAGDKGVVVQALCSLRPNWSTAAAEILPLVSNFGIRITGPGAPQQTERVDFRWEREWRYPYAKGPLSFENNDLFVGLCPHGEIEFFEEEFSPLLFVDPMRPMKWYATKLIECRQRANIKSSVV